MKTCRLDPDARRRKLTYKRHAQKSQFPSSGEAIRPEAGQTWHVLTLFPRPKPSYQAWVDDTAEIRVGTIRAVIYPDSARPGLKGLIQRRSRTNSGVRLGDLALRVLTGEIRRYKGVNTKNPWCNERGELVLIE